MSPEPRTAPSFLYLIYKEKLYPEGLLDAPGRV